MAGPYDIVHSHVHYFSGFVLRIARYNGVATRVVHSHSDTSLLDENAGVARQFYLHRMRSWIDKYATFGLAASEKAAVALYGPTWKRNPRRKILHCGIDVEPFRLAIERPKLRAELGIPEQAWVIGHVGRFVRPKNHTFLIQIATQVIRSTPEAFFLLVGDGPLRLIIEREVARAGIASRVIFCGARDDVAKLMLGAMDLFLFPSLWEGVPLSLIEAQAAGLPCIISDVIAEESDVVPDLITRLSLNQAMSVWVDKILYQKCHSAQRNSAQASALVAKSTFNSEISACEMEKLYASL
jgi:glycosyltransferase involved in cell wall biosynthesis